MKNNSSQINTAKAEPPSDQLLIELAKNNNQEALEQLIKKYLKFVYRIVKYYIADNDEAEDVTQEIFVKVWKNLKKFQSDKNFKSWLGTIAKNSCLDSIKKKRALPFSSFENEFGQNLLHNTLADLSPNAFEIACKNGINEMIESAINRLSFPYQQAIILHSRQGLTFQEISVSTGQSLNTVKSRYRRALKYLRKNLV